MHRQNKNNQPIRIGLAFRADVAFHCTVNTQKWKEYPVGNLPPSASLLVNHTQDFASEGVQFLAIYILGGH